MNTISFFVEYQYSWTFSSTAPLQREPVGKLKGELF